METDLGNFIQDIKEMVNEAKPEIGAKVKIHPDRVRDPEYKAGKVGTITGFTPDSRSMGGNKRGDIAIVKWDDGKTTKEVYYGLVKVKESVNEAGKEVYHYANFKFLWSGYSLGNISPDYNTTKEFLKSKFPNAEIKQVGSISSGGLPEGHVSSDVVVISIDTPIEKEAYVINYPNLIEVSTWKRRVGVKAYDMQKKNRPGKALSCTRESNESNELQKHKYIAPAFKSEEEAKKDVENKNKLGQTKYKVASVKQGDGSTAHWSVKEAQLSRDLKGLKDGNPVIFKAGTSCSVRVVSEEGKQKLVLSFNDRGNAMLPLHLKKDYIQERLHMGFEDFIKSIQESVNEAETKMQYYATFVFSWSGSTDQKRATPDLTSLIADLQKKFPNAVVRPLTINGSGKYNLPEGEVFSEIHVASDTPIEKEALAVNYPNLIEVQTAERQYGAKARNTKRINRPGKALPV